MRTLNELRELLNVLRQAPMAALPEVINELERVAISLEEQIRPGTEELDHTHLANEMIHDVAYAMGPAVAQIANEQVALWLRRHQLELPALAEFTAADTYSDLNSLLFDPIGVAGKFRRPAQWQTVSVPCDD